MTNWFRELTGFVFRKPATSPTVTVTKGITFYNGPNWNGRTSVKRLANGTYMLVYMESTSHPNNTNSKAHVRFSKDGETWTDEEKYLDGSSVTNAPFIPSPSVSNSGAGEPWVYVAPNGTVIVHTWNCYYDVYNGGTHQWSSTDNGKTFTYDGKVTFTNLPNSDQVFATDDDFVVDGVIYAGARMYFNLTQDQGIKSMLIKNTNNGNVNNWEWVSDITSYSTPTNEVGMTYLGDKTILCILRSWPVGHTYKAVSTNMGITGSWTVTEITSGPFGVSGRHRLQSRGYLQGRAKWWKDPVIIATGFSNINPSTSTPRQSAIWISIDNGVNWSAAQYPEIQSEDGGYNSIMWHKGTYKYFTYFGATLTDGWIKQLNFLLTPP